VGGSYPNSDTIAQVHGKTGRDKKNVCCVDYTSGESNTFQLNYFTINAMCSLYICTPNQFVRRWLAERDLEIAIWSAIQIQASFRGWFARDSLEDNHYCATQIQRVARGYLATMHVFEDLYSITIVQSVARMHLAINRAVDRLSSIIAIQSWWRGLQARDHVDKMDYSAVAIQSQWRRYLAQMTYQFDMIDVIIVQSVARRWRDRRALATMRLQSFVRVMIAKKRLSEKKSMHALITRHTSATMIQARWRSHIAQSQLLYYIAATRIQATWRSYTAQVDMLVTIVNVIVIQVSEANVLASLCYDYPLLICF
jgi:myosin heavy subunit